ncbi:MAG: hypothetical protein AB8G86_10010 [Saprospiraceae bacterium]
MKNKLKFLIACIFSFSMCEFINCQNQFYIGAEIGGVLNNTRILSDDSGVLVDSELGENITGTFYFNLGWRRKRHLFELSFGKLQHKQVFTTSITQDNIFFYSTRASIRDYDYLGINYYYNLLEEDKILSLFIGGGLNIASLPTREQGGDNLIGTSTRKLIETCQTNSLEVIQEVIGTRATSFVGLELKLKLDIKIFERLHLSMNNKLFLWKNKEVITKKITTILDNDLLNQGRIQSNMPFYSLGIGIYYFF